MERIKADSCIMAKVSRAAICRGLLMELDAMEKALANAKSMQEIQEHLAFIDGCVDQLKALTDDEATLKHLDEIKKQARLQRLVADSVK